MTSITAKCKAPVNPAPHAISGLEPSRQFEFFGDCAIEYTFLLLPYEAAIHSGSDALQGKLGFMPDFQKQIIRLLPIPASHFIIRRFAFVEDAKLSQPFNASLFETGKCHASA